MADESADELSTVIREIQERVRARHPNGTGGGIPLADLMPLLHARDAAEAKVASIGSVNPRPPGLKNSIVQRVKRLVARALDWHVREQVEFNRALIGCVQATLEALTAQNRALSTIAAEQSQALAAAVARFSAQGERLQELVNTLGEENLRRSAEISALDVTTSELRATAATLDAEARELRDIRKHWAQWRQEWEAKLSHNEIVYLRNLAESHAAFQHRVTRLEEAYRDLSKTQHAEFKASLARTNLEIQKEFRDDLLRVRTDADDIIHRELRTLRQRSAPPMPQASSPAGDEEQPVSIDWLAFAERFRGSEDHVRAVQRLYGARLAGCRNVLDLGCGRGELLEVLRDAGIDARGIDANAECIALCTEKGLAAEVGDLFAYLASGGEQFDAIISAQVAEHLPPLRLPELIRLASERLAPGGILAIETPNPECLAILATHFWLDPTHTRPVPAPLLSFWMEEAGLGGIEVVPLNPAIDAIPALSELPEAVREALFGGMDYAIFGRKL